ncbi:MAG: adenosylcobinamide-GDP ribazoletransferase, partial [Bradyrhizobium sp.]|uniref:adenosylcobinamide-GDP ribazoletransferase n=1 Tax=Bradyrhizobium sp. TaxID=376 RepID=UPI003C7A43E0
MSVRGFWIALQFLTRLPTPDVTDMQADDLARSAIWFPAVGLVIGVLLALVMRVFQGSGSWVAALAVLVSWIVVTGALHLDGLGDVA